MFKTIQWLLISISLLSFTGHGFAGTVKSIKAYGVYAVSKKGYVKVTPYNHVDNFVDFKYLNQIPSVLRSSDKVKFIVYSKNFKIGSYRFEVRPIETTLTIRPITFSARPLEKKGMYELTLDKPVADGNMIHIYAPEVAGYRLGAIVLGDTQKELVKYFSEKQNKKAYAMHAYLKDALKAYPENKKLYDLLVYWQQKAKIEKDLKDYSYVDENWRKYKRAEKIYLKASYLRSMLGEINTYLTEHPHGKKEAEANKRKQFAEKKLKEYEPLL